LRCRADYFDLGNVRRKCAVCNRYHTKQDDDRDTADDVAANPHRGFTTIVTALRSVNPQTLEVFVFCVNRHNAGYGSKFE
jgi:hypothetical protein